MPCICVAALVARRYGDRVKHFATFNEPSVFTLHGYAYGQHAPGLTDRDACLAAIHHVNLAHGAAVDAIRAHVTGSSIGAIHNYQPCVAASDSAEDRAATAMLDALWNGAFREPQLRAHYPPALVNLMRGVQREGDAARICRPVDWFGLNHYAPLYVKAADTVLGCDITGAPPQVPLTPIGWPIEPEAFRSTLMTVAARYRLPIYVLENGAGGYDQVDAAGQVVDTDRIAYLHRYTDALRAAVKDGADVRGYFVWSLLDNFEWSAGYSQRFGLVHVDFATQKRTPKASARWYAALIRASRQASSGVNRTSRLRASSRPSRP